MRVLEIGLYSLGRHLGIDDIEVNWELAIQRIEKATKQFDSKAPARNDPDYIIKKQEWDEQRQFYSEAATHFRYIKDAWRNRTAHAGFMYQDDRAKRIFESVHEFMAHLAEHGLDDSEVAL